MRIIGGAINATGKKISIIVTNIIQARNQVPHRNKNFISLFPKDWFLANTGVKYTALMIHRNISIIKKKGLAILDHVNKINNKDN